MDKRARNILMLFGLALLAIIVIEAVRPQPINWRDSYTSKDKIPFGSYVIFEELQNWDTQKEVISITKNPFDFLKNKEYNEQSSYIFVNKSVNFDKRAYQELINYIRKGNNVFIAANFFGATLSDSLNIELDIKYDWIEEAIEPTFFHSSQESSNIKKFKKRINKTVFKSFDTTKTKALGYFKNEETPLSQINFIKIKEGDGTLFLSTLPEAFSNFYMLKGNDGYTSQLLSYLSTDTYYWDDYIKSGRKIIDSPMRFVLNQIGLKWAYYLLILGMIVFIIFRGKRQQRIIPVIPPLENSSIEFTQTIGDLYFNHKDYSNIIGKKTTYFLERVRSLFYLQTNTLDEKFIRKLAVKSGHSLEETKELITLINTLRKRNIHSEEDLIQLNKKIEAYSL